ncbi:hypothetical protein DIPPA_24461 [Diplonema papillatum]|nr:hypothetical protein DIPPA_24461 [Diplonema papillatum]
MVPELGGYAPGQGTLLNVPFNTSMMQVFEPKVKSMAAHLSLRAAELNEYVLPWNAAIIDHSDLVATAAKLKEDLHRWKKSQLQIMHGLWLEQSARYTGYKKQVARGLHVRHMSELEAFFGHLRFKEKNDDEGNSPTNPLEMANMKYITASGFGYERTNLLLNKVAERHCKENGILESITQRHTALLDEASGADALRLTKALNRVLELGQRCIAFVDQKIATSQQFAAAPNLYKRYAAPQLDTRRSSVPVAPLPDQPLAGHGAPLGSAMDMQHSDHDGHDASAAVQDNMFVSPRSSKSDNQGEGF